MNSRAKNRAPKPEVQKDEQAKMSQERARSEDYGTAAVGGLLRRFVTV